MKRLLTGSAGLWTCVVLIATGIAVVALAMGSRWATIEISEGGLPRQSLDVSGSDLLPIASAAVWPLLIASVVALVVLPTIGRRITGALVAVGALMAMFPASRFGLNTAKDLQSWLIFERPTASILSISTTSTWLLALVGCLLAIIGGVAAIAFSDTWPRLGSRYDRSPSAAAGAPTSADTWKALDRGEDPTA